MLPSHNSALATAECKGYTCFIVVSANRSSQSRRRIATRLRAGRVKISGPVRVKGNPEIASNYQGVTYLFASAANKADFDKDPAKYVPQYGGFCALAVANGVISGIEGADAFTVYKGKLYLGGNEDAMKSFKTDIDDNIEKADTYWRQLTGS